MRTVWLASYPKSGNTWFRMLVANLAAKDGQPADINNLPERGGIASARGPFDHLLLIDSGLLTHDEIDGLRPRVYEELARGAEDDEYDAHPALPPVSLVKCHDAYTRTHEGEPLLAGRRGADGAIMMVRDPRDIACSLAHHTRSSIDKAIDFMNDREEGFCRKTDRQHNQLRQRFLGWSGFIESWLAQTDIPVHLVRYEDLQADAAAVLGQALAFTGHAPSEARIAQAVAFSSFDQLRQQEYDKGFRETPRPAPDLQFFRRGRAGGWRDELTFEQAARIEAAHAPMMRRFGYEPTSVARLAGAG